MSENNSKNPIKIGMISLGCNKNQVDGEIMLSKLKENGYEICPDQYSCDVIIVNTCGFIESAKQESIENILECCSMKEEKQLKLVVVTGCLAERYKEELCDLIPEVDVVLGIGKNTDIVNAIGTALDGEKVAEFGEKTDLPLEGTRLLANAPYYAYLKIAEGCDNFCTYCAIPSIRGRFRSRTIENIVEEAKELARCGVKEINVIAQDTSRYGEDLYKKPMLPTLLKELCKIDDIKWIRIFYCYPERITDELLEVIRDEDKIVKYLDIPIQHASGRILKLMNRFGDFEYLKNLVTKIRKTVPDICLRTTLIAGFPSETEEDINVLCDFVKEMKFERLGCFAFSPEEGTPAVKLKGQLDEQTRIERADLVMREQMNVSYELAQKMLGKELLILAEGYDEENDIYFGRSYMDAPDIDTKTFFKSKTPVKDGEFYKVIIDETDGYDLLGHNIETEGESIKWTFQIN